MGRRNSGPPISLFSFQDIITSVTGIMILVTLLLGVELVQRTVNSPPVKTADITARLTAAADATEGEIKAIEQELQGRQQGVLAVAGLNSEALQRDLDDLEELTHQFQQELSESEKQKLESEQRRLEAGEEQTRRKDDRSLEQVKNALASAQSELEKLKQSNRVIFNPADGTSKRAWLVEISDKGFVVAEMGKAEPPQTFADYAAFQSWAAGRNAASEYFVLLVKPTGVKDFYAAFQRLQQLSFEVGIDLLTASQSAIDAQTGAGVK